MKTKPLDIETAILNVRRGTRGDEGFHVDEKKQHTSGFAEGSQINEAKARFPGKPILLLRKQAGLKEQNWSGQPFYAPTLIVPKTKFVFVFTVPKS